MAAIPEDILKAIKTWDRGQIGDHIKNQLQDFSFKTWASWKFHATEVCTLCKAVLARIDELQIQYPADETPIGEVISYMQRGRTSIQPRPHIEKLIDMIQKSGFTGLDQL
ncbi:hypothetical protein HYV31_03520 [candidate division WWE3 bacterium]|nr:hypothetical protein [candidate division WWE3 bacterium]